MNAFRSAHLFAQKLLLSTSVIFAFAASSSVVFGYEFGSDGRNGSSGYDGRPGRNGDSAVIQVNGSPAHYEISGDQGGDGGVGENGYRATNCVQPNRPASNLIGASGGAGGLGGDGGSGGNGGSVTAYFKNMDELKNIFIHATPGRGGHAAWGGRGEEGCRCQERSWTIPGPNGQTTSYQCIDGHPGRDASAGNPGQSGTYGRITLIPQMEPVLPEVPSLLISMPKMEDSIYSVSKNLWESRRGARALFATGSDLSDNYVYFAGRVEATVHFRWEAARPLSDFSNWQMRLELNGSQPVVRFPTGAWVDASWEGDGVEKTYVIKAVVAGTEIGSIQLDQIRGDGVDHVITIKDNGGMADVLHNSIHMQYFVAVAGQYQKKFDADIPAEAVSLSPNSIQIAMAKTGVDPALFKIGTQAYVGFVVTRTLGENKVAYQLGTYYTIKFTLNVGDAVEALQDSNLMSGNQIVGHIAKGDKFLVNKVQGDWINLKKPDGTVLQGWVEIGKLKRDSAPNP